MKNLILVRHAKSDWSLSLDDFDRTLTDRGRSDAKLVAEEVKSLLPESFTVWSSAARRAATTADIMTSVWDIPASDVNYRNDLYTFVSPKLEQVIRTCDADVESLVVFGHNEAITDFVNNFGDISIDNVPTAGLVWIIFTGSWTNFTPGKTHKVLFPKPLR